MFGDFAVLSQFAAADDTVRVATTSLGEAEYGIAVAPGNSYLRELIDFTLQDMKIDGTYDSLHQQWFAGIAQNPPSYAIEVSAGLWPYSFGSLPIETDPPQTDTFSKIRERGKLVVGVRGDQPPFGLRNADGQVVGFDPAIAAELARRWLGDAGAVEYVTGAVDEHIDRLVAGEIDLVAAAIDNERDWADLADFSRPYLGPPATGQYFQLALPQHDDVFRQLVDFTLQEMQQDGSYTQLFGYWLGAGTPAYTMSLLPAEAGYTPQAYLNAVRNARSTVARVRARNRKLIAGVKYDFAPFGFLDESGRVSGFDVDLVQALADSWGIDVEFAPVTSGNRIQKLADGEVDMVAASMTHTKARDADIDFSQTYFADGQSLLVRRDSGINGIQDLDGLRVAAIEGSTSIIQINDHAAANGVAVEIMPFQEYPPAVEELLAGGVAAVTTDSVALQRFARDNPELHVVGELFTHEPYGLGLRAGDSTFANLVNYSLQSLKESGEYDELYYKWFGDDSTPYAVEVLPGKAPYTFADAPAALETTDESTVDRIMHAGVIVAGVSQEQEPFGFLDNGEFSGFDVDLMREFAKRWLGDRDAVSFVPLRAEESDALLAEGAVDIVAALLPHERGRSEEIDVSQTYVRNMLNVITRRDDEHDGDYRSLAELTGHTVGVVGDGTLVGSTPNWIAAAKSAAVPTAFREFATGQQAVQALIGGEIDALLADSTAMAQLPPDILDSRLEPHSFAGEPYAIGARKYDHTFRDLINFTLQEMKTDGTYDRLYRRWFGSDDPFPVEVWPGESYLPISVRPMVRIHGGRFVRGSDNGLPDEQPEQDVDVDEFFIDQYEVTNRRYDLCVREGACRLPRLARSLASGLYYADPVFHNFPAIWVTWQDAADYCAFVGKRLPTEAEWEKAARGADALLYPWGEEAPVDQANHQYLLGDLAKVGDFELDESPYGVNDMAGNVREWTADWYDWQYYEDADDVNPRGPSQGTTRVVRGGAWDDDTAALRSSARRNLLPDSADANLGFRCASSSPPSR